MRPNKLRRLGLWALPAALAAVGALVLLAGLAGGLTGRIGDPIGPPPAAVAIRPPAPDGTCRIVALGDSLTRGAGDDGRGGYPSRVANALRGRGLAAEATNLGVDGLESGQLLEKLSSESTRRSVARASLLLVSISGNDLTHSLRDASAGDTGAALAKARRNVGEILTILRAENPAAPIRLLGLYDPAAPAEAALARRTLLLWNSALEDAGVSVEGALVVPVADLFAARPELLSPDRFHPGPRGYDEIAARIVSSLPDSLGGARAGGQSGR